MAEARLIPFSLDLGRYSLGAPQCSGPLTVIPVLGPEAPGAYASPLTDLKLVKVRGYGTVELENRPGGGTAIVPLHMGYIQHGAQNHALCRSALMGAGQKRTFSDACCVQESQGGFLKDLNAWFFVLPLGLREEALSLRGRESYGKLWPAISRLSRAYGLPARGHLEQLIGRRRAYLTQFRSRFELVPGQLGAVFVLGDRLVGLELAPTRAYFEEVWVPLVCFCYGPAAMRLESRGQGRELAPFQADDLTGLQRALEASRATRDTAVLAGVGATPWQDFKLIEDSRFCDLRLCTAQAGQFVGQVVLKDKRLVYASVSARAGWAQGVERVHPAA